MALPRVLATSSATLNADHERSNQFDQALGACLFESAPRTGRSMNRRSSTLPMFTCLPMSWSLA